MVNTIGIVSLSSGVLGEDFIKHELDIGIDRLENMGVKVKFMPNSRKGMSYLSQHPEKRAEDLVQAYKDDDIDMILCAIGGDDTYRTLTYLLKGNVLDNIDKNKMFLGYSDSTINHFMLNKLGINTFYGQAFLSDVCELDKEMLDYTEYYFRYLIENNTIDKIKPSKKWFESREDFGKDQIGVALKSHPNNGFELLQGPEHFQGEILGGCLDSIYDIFDDSRHSDMPAICERYNLFPSLNEWKNKILLLETSEEMMSPYKYRDAIKKLKEYGIFSVISGVLVGKPFNNVNKKEYEDILVEEIDNSDLPIMSNINVGHCLPRCIIPFGKKAKVDYNERIKVKTKIHNMILVYFKKLEFINVLINYDFQKSMALQDMPHWKSHIISLDNHTSLFYF